MSNFSSASIILALKKGRTDLQIWHAVRALGKANCRAEVLLVDGNPSDSLNERITYRPIPKRFQSVSEAIEAAKHPLVAIIDSEVQADPDQWTMMAKRIQQAPVQTWFRDRRQSHKNLNWYKRILFLIYTTIVRFVLKTRKSEFHPGITLLNRDALDVVLKDFGTKSHDETKTNFGFESTKLIALARLHRVNVIEDRTDSLPAPIANNELGAANCERIATKNITAALGTASRFWWNSIMFPKRQQEFPQKNYKPVEKLAAAACLVLLAAFVLFRCLNFPLFEPDEARNAQLALNVVESGNWMSMTLAEDYYWDKPPLQIWAIATSYKLFGVSQFTTRLPVGLAALATLLFTLLIGRRLVGFRSALLGAFLLLLTTGFVCSGRYVTMDASLTAMTTAMLLFGFTAINGRFKKKHAIAAGVACGIGLLVKGPVIGVLCVPPLFAAWFLAGSTQHSFRLKDLLWFVVPACLISAPWFIATAIIHPDFLTYFFWTHHVVRFSEAFNHREPAWYYVVGIFIFMFPASYLIPSVVRFMTSRKPENRLLRTREHGFLFLSAIWIIGFFSISESKLPTYIIPAFPPICLLMGVLLNRKLFSKSQFSIADVKTNVATTKRFWIEKIGRRAPFELLFWFVVTGVAVLAFADKETFSIPSLIGSMVLLCGLVLASNHFRSKPKIAWACCGAMAVFMVTLTAHQLIPAISQSRSIHTAVKNIQSTDEFESAPIVFFGRETYGSSLTINQAQVSWFDETDVLAMIRFLESNPTAVIVSSEDPMETLRRDLPWTIALDERNEARHLYTARPNPTLIARQPSQIGSLVR